LPRQTGLIGGKRWPESCPRLFEQVDMEKKPESHEPC
jgi:hypothetical protein